MLALIAGCTFLATLLGGFFAIQLRDRLHLILGFSAGAVVGLAFFELLPEALELAASRYDVSTILTFAALGFVSYLALDRAILLHGHNHDHEDDLHRGYFGAGSLSLHSFLDGIGIGLSFQLSPIAGIIMASAVLAHGFSDGINIVNLVTRAGGDRRRAITWVLSTACAPTLGIIFSLFFTISAETLGLLLSLFAGFFLYLGASDLIPESHHAHPVRWTTIATIVGFAFLYLITIVAERF
jgi:zinc transporter ZupT